MKFLCDASLESFNARYLTHAMLDEGIVLDGCLEKYSCKEVREDKRLYRDLETRYSSVESYGELSLGTSPLGPISQPSTRRLLGQLIRCLNISFNNDYDFSAVTPDDFEHLTHEQAILTLEEGVFDLMAKALPGAKEAFFSLLKQHIEFEQCEIYRYSSDPASDDVLSEGKLFSLNYFFVDHANRAERKILFFTASAVRYSYSVGLFRRCVKMLDSSLHRNSEADGDCSELFPLDDSF